jgi:hypothetical protein
MADETEVVEQDQQTEETEKQADEKISQSIEELVKTEQSKKTEDEPIDKTEKTEKEKKPVKVSANERIQQLTKERDELKANSEKQVSELKSEIASIQAKLQAGEITQQQADRKIETAEDRFKATIDGIELDDDLKPYKDSIIRAAQVIAKQMIDTELEPIKTRLYQEQEIKQKAEQDSFVNSILDHYKSTAKDYSVLFKDDPDENGYPVFKTPELEAEAEKLAQNYNVPFYDEQGKVSYYNAMFSTKEGIKHLLDLLSFSVDKSLSLKEKIAQQEKIKRSVVETPSARKVSGNGPLDIVKLVEQEIQSRGG